MVRIVRTFCCQSAENESPTTSAGFGGCFSAQPARHETTRPSFKNTIRSAVRRASSSSWVTMMSVVPRAADLIDEQGDDFPGRGRVEVAGWLVGEQDFGAVDQCPGDRHPLVLAA